MAKIVGGNPGESNVTKLKGGWLKKRGIVNSKKKVVLKEQIRLRFGVGVSIGFINLELTDELVERHFNDVGGEKGGNHTTIICTFVFGF